MVRPRGIDEAVQGSAPVGGQIRNVIYLPFERVNASLVRTSRGYAIGAVNQHSIHGAKECRSRERRRRGQLWRGWCDIRAAPAAGREGCQRAKEADQKDPTAHPPASSHGPQTTTAPP